ncbi:hypothetical protein [Piscinibacter sp. HJYY11]|uniref:hypothetical protein n=1 Tax=Piscinibacter sp. HJYY11 TaxID=2801333 RepID=UPI00191D179B|nr:hypothetical protein [Piscinibacter sp. HJYY11]MBL0730734.1 hypothetical protein [Piscinibacter sp. HJYY11]
MQSEVEVLDVLLRRSDCDSLAWADGGDAEDASALLQSLSNQQWTELVTIRAKRNASWRACLVSVLQPSHGRVAQRLLLDSASDQDAEVAFLAARSISFYCGVNASAQGPFIDFKIRNRSFLSQAKETAGLVDQVRKVDSLCAPEFQRQFELLEAVLEARA